MARSPPAPGVASPAIRVTTAGPLVAGVPLRLLSAGRIFPDGTAELTYSVA
ncbi:MAG TPA: hypothetical protein VLL69_15110 [Streptosporangiaceae bacterium]|nr:hypothetical protein [Streptosporangiaceae bacterium]